MVEIPFYLHTLSLSRAAQLGQECGEAEGPSRERDAEVWWLLADHSGDDPEITQLVADHGLSEAIDRLWGKAWRLDPTYPSQVPRYTESLDAVLALRARVLPGSRGLVLTEYDYGGSQAEAGDEVASGRTLAGALLRAVLGAVALAAREVQNADYPSGPDY